MELIILDNGSKLINFETIYSFNNDGFKMLLDLLEKSGEVGNILDRLILSKGVF